MIYRKSLISPRINEDSGLYLYNIVVMLLPTGYWNNKNGLDWSTVWTKDDTGIIICCKIQTFSDDGKNKEKIQDQY